MAKLELVPQISHVLAQGGAFVVASAIVRHYFLDPYRTLTKKRDEETLGLKNQSQALEKQSLEIKKHIESAIVQAKKEAMDHGAKLKMKANQEQEKLAATARRKAETMVEKSKEQVFKQLAEEQQKLAPYIKIVTDELLRDAKS